MKREVVTLSHSLTQPIGISFICEHCGESNLVIQDIVGVGTKSGGKQRVDRTYSISPKDSIEIANLAQKDLEYKIKKIEKKTAKDNYSWINTTKCVKCQHFQSWNNRRLWKDFLKLFFGAPFLVLMLVGFPISLIYKNTSDYPLWLDYTLTGIILTVMFGAVIYLLKSLSKNRSKNRNKPSYVMLPIR